MNQSIFQTKKITTVNGYQITFEYRIWTICLQAKDKKAQKVLTFAAF